jgi:hypothetical protein
MFRQSVNVALAGLVTELLTRVKGLEEAYEVALDLHGEDHPLTQRIDNTIGVIYATLDCLDESREEAA